MTGTARQMLNVSSPGKNGGVEGKMRKSQPSESLRDKVDELFAEWDRADSPGCALGIIQHGEMIYKRGYGIANLEHDVPISSTTVFRVGSISKQFTATSILLLAEQGKLSLDDDIRTHLPEMQAYQKPITIRHLIHHTSGIKDWEELMRAPGRRQEDYYTAREELEVVAGLEELDFAPGSEFRYSNSGYFLMAVILERTADQSLREFAEEHIFKPLGMAHTHFHDDHTMIVKNRATGYTLTGDGAWRIYETHLDIVGDHGLFTTVQDLFIWDQNFYHNAVGRRGQDLVHQLCTPSALDNGQPLDYAFGLRIDQFRGLRGVRHSGTYVGFKSKMIRFPEQEFSVICLCNLRTMNPKELAQQVADIYLADRYVE